MPFPFGVPLYPAGHEPLPPGLTEEDRVAYNQQLQMTKYIQMGMESCVFKCGMAGAGGVYLFLFYFYFV